MLLDRRQIAKISSKPGKTQLINHFLIDDTWHLVDLPGYGWAKVSKAQRVQWEKMVRTYLIQRKQLSLVLVLVDARHKPQKLDVALINWLGENKIPFVILFTKADKESKHQVQQNMAALKQVLQDDWKELPKVFITSSKEGTGREEVLEYVQQAFDKTNK